MKRFQLLKNALMDDISLTKKKKKIIDISLIYIYCHLFMIFFEHEELIFIIKIAVVYLHGVHSFRL